LGVLVAEADRYGRASILRSERMYGRGYQSPGQVEAVEAACAMLDLRPGMRVLDVGCGLGGPAMHLAREHGLRAVGVDVAHDMVELSRERLAESGLTGVEILEGDLRALGLEPASFDLIWTRDAILYVPDKGSIWRCLHELLRPNGRLYAADFCRGVGKPSPDVEAYLDAAGYHLQTLAEYEATLRASGFGQIDVLDQTPLFDRALDEELNRLERTQAAFPASFSRHDYEYLVQRWRTKIDFCRRGELVWGWFLARS
jgi:phosphoethanolamine N-methyltransferase